jgi:hypothetical protein
MGRSEGIRTGLVGAVAVAAVFLVYDLIQGRPGWTPSVLGQVVLTGGGQAPVLDRVLLWPVIFYTAVHIALFAVFGMVLAKMVALADTQRIFRFALVILFMSFEVLFLGVLEVGVGATRGLFPYWVVLAANGVAALAMGYYIIRRHPATARGYAADSHGY